MESSLAWEIMWNDPFSVDQNSVIPVSANVSNGFFNNARRSTGKYFTNEALMAFLERNRFTHVVRAHEVQQVGFKVGEIHRTFTVIRRLWPISGAIEWPTVDGLFLFPLLRRNE